MKLYLLCIKRVEWLGPTFGLSYTYVLEIWGKCWLTKSFHICARAGLSAVADVMHVCEKRTREILILFILVWGTFALLSFISKIWFTVCLSGSHCYHDPGSFPKICQEILAEKRISCPGSMLRLLLGRATKYHSGKKSVKRLWIPSIFAGSFTPLFWRKIVLAMTSVCVPFQKRWWVPLSRPWVGYQLPVMLLYFLGFVPLYMCVEL